MAQKVVLLVNTGTPDNPDASSVKRYLKEFLNDPMVINIPWIFRRMLVNLFIVPFRSSGSSRLYKRLWTREGSPLKINLEKLVCKLQLKMAGRYKVLGAMRYGTPSINSVLQTIKEESDLVVVPLFPQFARATTGSVNETILRESKYIRKIQSVKFVEQFYSHPAFVKVFSERISRFDREKFDHIVFSYHSLPVSQIKKIHPAIIPQNCDCDKRFPEYGYCCYKASCHMTTRLIAGKLNLKAGFFTTSFQSRMSKRWIGPFTDQVLKDLAYSGKMKVLVVAPSFVSDCLETLIEIKEDYKKLFIAAGGKDLVLIESLNHEDDWVEALRDIIEIPAG